MASYKFTRLFVGDAVKSNSSYALKKLSASNNIELPAVGTPLEDCTWEQISAISAAGKSAEYFSIGDTKSVYLKGTVGTLNLDTTFYVYIIGFDHNSEIEGTGITFGTFKTADGKDVCLVDSQYYLNVTSDTKYFTMNHGTGGTIGGWQGCDIRYDVLGSVDVKDAQHAGDNTATTPVANTLMAALPSELRAVMKPITKYTDNAYSSEGTAETVTITTDYLPLLAEFEIFGECKYANSYEQNYQKQYAYYSAGSTARIKYQHSANSNTANWWERSIRNKSISEFCYILSNGVALFAVSKYSYGLAPIFKV